jgi:hypothetical protein
MDGSGDEGKDFGKEGQDFVKDQAFDKGKDYGKEGQDFGVVRIGAEIGLESGPHSDTRIAGQASNREILRLVRQVAEETRGSGKGKTSFDKGKGRGETSSAKEQDELAAPGGAIDVAMMALLLAVVQRIKNKTSLIITTDSDGEGSGDDVEYMEGTGASSSGLQVFVKTLRGVTVCIPVDADAMVDTVRAMLAEKESIPAEMQLLYTNGKRMVDGESLSKYGIEHNSTVHMAARLLGGGGVRRKITKEVKLHAAMGKSSSSRELAEPVRELVNKVSDSETFIEDKLQSTSLTELRALATEIEGAPNKAGERMVKVCLPFFIKEAKEMQDMVLKAERCLSALEDGLAVCFTREWFGTDQFNMAGFWSSIEEAIVKTEAAEKEQRATDEKAAREQFLIQKMQSEMQKQLVIEREKIRQELMAQMAAPSTADVNMQG